MHKNIKIDKQLVSKLKKRMKKLLKNLIELWKYHIHALYLVGYVDMTF